MIDPGTTGTVRVPVLIPDPQDKRAARTVHVLVTITHATAGSASVMLRRRVRTASRTRDELAAATLALAQRLARSRARSGDPAVFVGGFVTEASRLLRIQLDPATRRPLLLARLLLLGAVRDGQDALDAARGITRQTRRREGGTWNARRAARLVAIEATDPAVFVDKLARLRPAPIEERDRYAWTEAQLPDVRTALRRYRRTIDWERLPMSASPPIDEMQARVTGARAVA